jgi:predicted dehydrogenase
MRFWPGWSWLKQVVEEQRFGKVLSARFRRLSEMPGWSKQGTYKGGNDLGGALFDLHIHDVDFVQFLFGRPTSVYANGVTSAGGSIDHVVAQYQYPGGPTVYAEGSWLFTKGFTMAYTLLCERATLDYDLSRGADALQVTEAGQDPKTVPLDGPDGYSQEIEYVLSCALQQKSPSTVTAADGLSALEICEAEEKSIQTGTVVSL